MTASATEKRAKALDAALACFERYGYQRTSMEMLAREARMSRPALYQYFSGKEDVFRAMVRRMHDTALERVEASLTGDGPATERLVAVLTALLELREDKKSSAPSQHRAELLEEITARADDLRTSFEHEVRALLRQVVLDAGAGCAPERHDMTADDVAALLFYGAKGLMHECASPETTHTRLHQLVGLVMEGMCRPGPTDAAC